MRISVALALSASTGGETVLLDFSADWCAPCRSMEPTINQLTTAGYPVRRVNIDRDPSLAQKFHVQNIPCFVLLVDGREVDRQVGPSDVDHFKDMFKRANVAANKVAAGASRAQSPDSAAAVPLPAVRGEPLLMNPRRLDNAARAVASAVAKPNTGSPADSAMFVSASVRLKIEDAKGNSYGSGTIIDAGAGEALILTCGHVFRESQGKGRISVDLFGPRGIAKVEGRLVDFDLKSDLGLVAIRTDAEVVAVRVAPLSYQVRRGDKVVTVGCDHGADPTARESSVSGIDKFLGPPNLQIAGQPVQGRSGGGLFSREGYVIGVCNAADPTDNEGLFAAASSIHALLDRSGLAFVYRTGDEKSSVANVAAAATPAMPVKMPSATAVPVIETTLPVADHRDPASRSGASAQPLSAEERATLASIRDKARDSEVVCIVRPLNDPQAKSEVIMLNQASAGFVSQLKAEARTQESRQPTPPMQSAPQTMTSQRVSPTTEPVLDADAGGWRPSTVRR